MIADADTNSYPTMITDADPDSHYFADADSNKL
jgi:hypothetical protein